jgi:RNA-directed DNA polymerase
MSDNRLFSSVTEISQLASLLHVSPGEISHILCTLSRQYRRRSRKKPDGSRRRLLVPSDRLKLLQKKINDHILAKVPLLSCVKGGVKGSSVMDNGAGHCRKEIVFTMDIEQCFPSIGPQRVRAIYQALGFGLEAVNILTKLTTFGNELPQGVPTSTALANLSLTRVDVRITKLQLLHGFEYTRWVDDLTFSGGRRLLKLRGLFRRIVEDEGFRIKERKTKTMLASQPQVVTGLVVNTKVNLPRGDRAEIKKQVIQAVSHGQPFTPELAGKVYWLRSVNAQVGERLLNRVKKMASGGASSFSKYRGIGNSEIGSGRKKIDAFVRELRGR